LPQRNLAILGHSAGAIFIESPMPGYANLVRLGLREGTSGRSVGAYQFTYVDGGRSWDRTFDQESALAEFLRSNVAVPAKVVDSALEELRGEGHVTLTEVDIRESEAPAMGLELTPSES
jgi:hypothetical protein